MDRVEVSLSFQSQHPEDSYPERRITLDGDTQSVQIGRTSKRIAELAPAIKNGWLDSPVISREHAELGFDPVKKVVYVTDQESRHGTYLNQIRLEANTATPIHDGDILKFGIDIQRDNANHPPPSARVGITMNPSGEADIFEHNPHTARFSVPDESDSEASSEDDDSAGIRKTMQTLRSLAGKPQPRMAAEPEVETEQAAISTILSPCGADLIDLDDEVTTVGPTVVDLTRESPACEVAHHHNKDDDVCGAPGKVSFLIDASESHGNSRKAPDHVEHRPQDVYELSDDDSEQDDYGDQDSCVYDAEDNVPVSGHIAWEADSLPSSPVPVCSGALLDDPSKYDSTDESDQNSAESEAESESDGSQSMDYDFPDEDDIEEEATCCAGRGNHHHDGSSQDEAENEEGCAENPFDEMPCSADAFSSCLTQPTSTAFTNLMPAPMPQEAPVSDFRLPPLSVMLPSQSAPVHGLDSRCLEFPPSNPARDPCGLGSYWPIYTTFPQNGGSHPMGWGVPDKAYPSLAEPCREPAKTAEPPLTSQSPLITSGEKFLSSPPQEFSVVQRRDSPELDMSSASQFQHSKIINSASKTKPDASLSDVPSGEYTVAAMLTAPEVERAIRVEQLLSEPDKPEGPTLNPSKRKADDISDLTDAEKKAENAADGFPAEPAMPTEAPKDAPQINQGPSNPSSHLITGDDTVPAPKRLRRMAEAARFVALGGVTAGAAVFAALVATAPTFT